MLQLKAIFQQSDLKQTRQTSIILKVFRAGEITISRFAYVP